MDAKKWFAAELKKIEAAGLYREQPAYGAVRSTRLELDGREYIAFCSNDYLGLASDERLVEAGIEAAKRWGIGARASRLISGTLEIHRELELRIAKLKGCEDALLFPSGFMANVGLFSAITGPGDIIISDEYNHASIVDGCRLSKAETRVYSHANTAHIETILKKSGGYSNRIIVTDGIFSMDGDIAPLPEIFRLAKQYDAWVMVDDAHATGVLGESGHGSLEFFGLPPAEISVGTLSKALGCAGGFVCGSKELIALVRNRSRSFIYTTAIPPAVCGAALAALDILENEPQRLARLKSNATLLRNKLKAAGFKLMGPDTPPVPLVPVLIGASEDAVAMSKRLMEEGMIIPAIRPPTVPEGESRLRITVSAAHTEDDIACLAETMERIQ